MSGLAGERALGADEDAGVVAAGALAERGVRRLVLRVAGVEHPLDTRVTDLPGLVAEALARAGQIELVDPEGGAVLRLGGGRIAWRGADAWLDAALRGVPPMG